MKILQYYAESEQSRLAVHLQEMIMERGVWPVSRSESHRVARRVLREVVDSDPDARTLRQSLAIILVYHLAKTHHDLSW